MKKGYLLKAISGSGDCFLKIKGRTDEPLCTIDFSTKYIKNKRKRLRMRLDFGKSKKILVFNWDADKFENIEPRDVLEYTPLASILNNRKKV